jgi:hypothetical protein
MESRGCAFPLIRLVSLWESPVWASSCPSGRRPQSPAATGSSGRSACLLYRASPGEESFTIAGGIRRSRAGDGALACARSRSLMTQDLEVDAATLACGPTSWLSRRARRSRRCARVAR